IIIETTNDPASKFMIIEYASQKRIPVISMSASEYKAKLGVYNPHSRRRDKKKLIENIVFAEFTGKRQGPTVSQVIAGLGIEEARKYIMPLRNEKIIDDIVAYNLLSNKRFECTDDKELTALDNFSEKTCLMVGAGALGNFAGLDLVLNNIGTLMIADFDTVESTNLNRQIWFYDSVGRLKAEALVEKLKKVNPNVKFDYSRSKVTPESEFFFKENKIDLMIDTVDNNSTRALLNYFAVKYQIPFISGGTRYNSGQVTVYKPGESACLNCQADIDQLALASYHPASCIYAAEPSVITSNQIIGGIIGGESKVILNPEKYGRVIPFVLKYVSNEAFRLGALPSPAATCECHADKKKTKKWLKKMKHLYEVKK
ncbi:ThiF family adenylyltransferase, partial [Candidatus Woesearchaeota archaeon]|nr:ThiF family adenylyltransferase [Candidatus Woesearchaeota archaeon]